MGPFGSMDELRVSTENPRQEQWRLLREFSYPRNVTRYFEGHGIEHDAEVSQYVAGCLRQREAYFRAYEQAPLDIQPLLLYYGCTNILAGACGLIRGHRPPISGHGMALRLAKEASELADHRVFLSGTATGGLATFVSVFPSFTPSALGTEWSLREVFGSIPDLRSDFEGCYSESPFTIPVTAVQAEGRILDRVRVDDLSRECDRVSVFERVPGYSERYLRPQTDEHMDYVVMNRRLEQQPLGIFSISGRRYLEVAHVKGRRSLLLDQVLLYLVALYALGYLSRYHPETWNPFVEQDQTGERLFIEKLFDVAARYVPNLILNRVKGQRVQFVYETEDVVRSPTQRGQ